MWWSSSVLTWKSFKHILAASQVLCWSAVAGAEIRCNWYTEMRTSLERQQLTWQTGRNVVKPGQDPRIHEIWGDDRTGRWVGLVRFHNGWSCITGAGDDLERVRDK